MPDLDQLLRDAGSISRAAEGTATTPDFAGIAARGRRRAHVRQGLTGASVAAVVAGVIGLTQVVGTDDAAPPPPTGPSTPKVEIKEAPAGHHPVDVASTTDPDVRAVVWERRDGSRELRLTDDGFATSAVVDVPEESVVLGADNGRFIVSGGTADTIELFDTEGAGTPVDAGEQVAPASAGETPVVVVDPRTGAPAGLVAVDPETATSHPVELPHPSPYQVIPCGDRLQVLGVVGDELRYYWSEDGGATWDEATLGPAEGFPSIVPSTPSEPRTVIEMTSTDIYQALTTVAGPTDIAVDEFRGPGRIDLRTVFSYEGETRLAGIRSGAASDAGVYVVNGATVERISPEMPGLSAADFSIVETEQDAPSGVVIWAVSPTGGLLRSGDGGETFQLVAAR